MKNPSILIVVAALLSACAIDMGPRGFRSSSWQLVRIQDAGGAVIVPDVKAKYMLDFDQLGELTLRIDCNRGHAKWESPAPGQLAIKELDLTKAACPRGSLHDRVVQQLPAVRTYTVEHNRLLLSFADGATYELQPSGTMGTVSVP